MTKQERIEALAIEAGQAGDAETVALCERAMEGDADAAAVVIGDAMYHGADEAEVALVLPTLTGDAEYVGYADAVAAQLPVTIGDLADIDGMTVRDAVRLAMHDVYRAQVAR